MTYRPNCCVEPCPVCHGIVGPPVVQRKRFLSRWVRLQCPCGVAGPWREDTMDNTAWNIAGQGWGLLVGSPRRPPPPRFPSAGRG